MDFASFLPLASSALGFISQDETNQENRDLTLSGREFNSAEAQKNRDYQTEMSNTAYQRAVKDMMTAGLNPMLAYSQGGASTPSGSAASAPSAAPMGNKGTAAAQAGMATAAMQNTQADTAQKAATERNLDADTENKKAELAGKQGSGQLNDAQVANLRANTTLALANADLAANTKEKVIQEVNNLLASEENIRADTALKKVNEILQRYDIPRMSAEAAYFKTPIGATSPHNKYGPQTPFRFIEGLGERFFSAKDFNQQYSTPDTGQKYHPNGRTR
ncbi:MAG: DNA pilot protein [Microviridae sp.]|nr:MAG: DNA pilot protein [Microviridae sp.]